MTVLSSPPRTLNGETHTVSGAGDSGLSVSDGCDHPRRLRSRIYSGTNDLASAANGKSRRIVFRRFPKSMRSVGDDQLTADFAGRMSRSVDVKIPTPVPEILSLCGGDCGRAFERARKTAFRPHLDGGILLGRIADIGNRPVEMGADHFASQPAIRSCPGQLVSWRRKSCGHRSCSAACVWWHLTAAGQSSDRRPQYPDIHGSFLPNSSMFFVGLCGYIATQA
jgi:hypothetical protein